MIFPAAIPAVVDHALQVIAALLIFIAGYLGLIVCTIIGLVIAQLAANRAPLTQAYGAKVPKQP